MHIVKHELAKYKTNFSKASHFSQLTMTLFALIFASLGTYFLLFSHASSALPGDINKDGIVDVKDLSLLLSSYGSNTSACVTASQYTCDLNGDEVVNVIDLSILLSDFGETTPTVTLTANPTSITSGSSSTLTWSSTNATSCSAASPSGWTSSTATSGTQSVSPTSTTSYTLTCTGAGGSNTSSPAVVTVSGSTVTGCTYNGSVAPCMNGAGSGTGASGWGAPTFDDEFNGTSLDTSQWVAVDGWNINNVTTSSSNVSVSGGNLILTLASSSSGAAVTTDRSDWVGGANGYYLPVGGYVEARVYFPGSGTSIYNWPAWWASGPCWPAAGEIDIFEGLGTATSNYHYGTCGTNGNAINSPTIPGTWSNTFHTYGVYRKSGENYVYWDGNLVTSYASDDNGDPEALLFNVGNGNTAIYGTASQVKVDYVRAW